jgi:putative tryptophan/tyrosine transport system substrate-binding protein
MRRREVLWMVAGTAFAWPHAPLPPLAQDAEKPARVGILDQTAAGLYSEQHYWSAFRKEMHALGYIEGKNILFDIRWANHDLRRLPSLTVELVSIPVDLIVAISTPVALAARSITSSVPIVVPLMADPVGVGLVVSLARPGGNVTGLSTFSASLGGKRLELLRDLVPTMTRAAVVWDDSNPAFRLTVQQVEAAAHSLGISAVVVGLHAAGGFEKAIAKVTAGGAKGLILAVGAGVSLLGGNMARVTAFVEHHRLPTIYAEQEYVRLGGLASYRPSYIDLFRRAATYAGQILAGASPADLPVQAPSKFEFVVNLKSARAMNLTIPPALLAMADELIE